MEVIRMYNTMEKLLVIMEDQKAYGRARQNLEERLSPNPLQTKYNGRKVYCEGYGWGTIYGGYLNPDNHTFIFSAFHIKFANGTYTTLPVHTIVKMARS
jgi:hypothetical protein